MMVEETNGLKLLSTLKAELTIPLKIIGILQWKRKFQYLPRDFDSIVNKISQRELLMN